MERKTGLEPATYSMGSAVADYLVSGENGAEDGTRTRYLQLGKLSLYQVSYFRL